MVIAGFRIRFPKAQVVSPWHTNVSKTPARESKRTDATIQEADGTLKILGRKYLGSELRNGCLIDVRSVRLLRVPGPCYVVLGSLLGFSKKNSPSRRLEECKIPSLSKSPNREGVGIFCSYVCLCTGPGAKRAERSF